MRHTIGLFFVLLVQMGIAYGTDYIVLTDNARIYSGNQVIGYYPRGSQFSSFERRGDWVLLATPAVSGWIASSDLQVKANRGKPALPTAVSAGSQHTHGHAHDPHHGGHGSSVLVHRDEKLHFELSYPSTWEEKYRSGGKFLINRILRPGDVGSISVDVSDYTQNSLQIQQLISFKNVNILMMLTQDAKKQYPDYEVIDHNTTHLGNHPAYIIVAKRSVKNLGRNIPIKTILIFAYHEKKLYHINFEVKGTEDGGLKGDFDSIISSFKYL